MPTALALAALLSLSAPTTGPAVSVSATPSSLNITAGSNVTLQVQVTNSGTVALAPVSVASSAMPSCARNVSSLGAGLNYSYSCTLLNVQASYTETLTATGTYAGGTVTGNTTSQITVGSGGGSGGGVTMGTPLQVNASIDGYSLTCIADGASFDASHTPITSSFQCYGAPSVTCDIGAGSSWTYAFQQAFINCISPAPTAPFGLLLTPSLSYVTSGATAPLQVVAYNNTQSPITNVSVSSGTAPACAMTIASLPAMSHQALTCRTPALSIDTTELATAKGTAAGGAAVSATASAAIEVTKSQLAISVTPLIQTLLSAGPASWKVMVTNAGNLALSNVIAADSATTPSCAQSLGGIGVGVMASFTCTKSTVAATMTDQFSAAGEDSNAKALVADTNATVLVGDEIFKNGFQ